MNIFVLDEFPYSAAPFYNDRHLCKAILECAQYLAVTHYFLDGAETANARTGYITKQVTAWPHIINDPWGKWVRSSRAAYSWMHSLMGALLLEYRRRFGHPHSYSLPPTGTTPTEPNRGSITGRYSGRVPNLANTPKGGTAAALVGGEGGIWGTLHQYPLNLPIAPRPPWPLAIPARYHRSNEVESYRLYYWHEKQHMAVWNKGRDAPPWWWVEMDGKGDLVVDENRQRRLT